MPTQYRNELADCFKDLLSSDLTDEIRDQLLAAIKAGVEDGPKETRQISGGTRTVAPKKRSSFASGSANLEANKKQQPKRQHTDKVIFVEQRKQNTFSVLRVQCPYCTEKVRIDNVLSHTRECNPNPVGNTYSDNPFVVCPQCGTNVKWRNLVKHTQDVHTQLGLESVESVEPVGLADVPQRPGYIYCNECEKLIPKSIFRFHAPCLPPSNSIRALRGGLPD
jgi:endogenous inhibitor of DNA gyrase (YacG/DUF329 family)